eukprot:9450776-Pyramimonas_sp.AAC.1
MCCSHISSAISKDCKYDFCDIEIAGVTGALKCFAIFRHDNTWCFEMVSRFLIQFRGHTTIPVEVPRRHGN